MQATVATLSGRFRLSRREVAELCETVLEAPLSVGSVATLCQATSVALAAPVAAAVATLPDAAVVNADETPWKEGKARPWLWVAVTALVTVFQIATSRSSQVIKGLLGEDYSGTLGTDRYAGYAWLDVAWRQVCWAHLTRDFQALVDRGGPARPLGTAALVLVHDLFTAWHQFRNGTLDRPGLQMAIGRVDEALAALTAHGRPLLLLGTVPGFDATTRARVVALPLDTDPNQVCQALRALLSGQPVAQAAAAFAPQPAEMARSLRLPISREYHRYV